MAFQHQAGTAMECLSVRIPFDSAVVFVAFLWPSDSQNQSNCFSFSVFFYRQQIPIIVHKEIGCDAEGSEVMKCGFKIGGGIDQNYKKSPQGYTDNVRFNLLTILQSPWTPN